MFLPTTDEELKALGWERPDVILVTGDAYIDSPHIGVAVIGKYLLHKGFKTAVIAQPSLKNGDDIKRLGEPGLFWGVTAGCIDSMVANYTATKKFRRQDDYTPGGVNRRPNRATITYTNLIRQHFKSTKPIVLGGLEASLRRIVHYDYWDDSLRRSLLFDAAADILVYGMAETTIVELAQALRDGADWRHIRGICHISPVPQGDGIPLPSFEEASLSKQSFRRMSELFHKNADSTSHGFLQQHGDRFLIHNPPPLPLSTEQLDGIYDLDFEDDAHPYYKIGEIRALKTIRQSLTTHRGCFGQCNFCAIAVHQGRRIVSRSIASLANEALRIKRRKGFNGIIYDVGGPTANMYGAACRKGWVCKDKHCLMPRPCLNLRFGHGTQRELLRRLRLIPGIKKVFVASGIRPDLVMADKEQGKGYLEDLVRNHISGQIKLAPEHSEPDVLAAMNKPSVKSLLQCKALYDHACATAGKRLFMTYYLIAAHPGCTKGHMERLSNFMSSHLKIVPEQVQIFTPAPSTISTAMYYGETDRLGKKLFCEKSRAGKEEQKNLLTTARRKRPNS